MSEDAGYVKSLHSQGGRWDLQDIYALHQLDHTAGKIWRLEAMRSSRRSGVGVNQAFLAGQAQFVNGVLENTPKNLMNEE